MIAFLAFCAVYAVDGLLREQKYELLTYIGGVLVIMIYVISNYIDKGKEHEEIRLVSLHLYIIIYLEDNLQIRLIVLCALGPLNIILALMVFYRMGFLEMNVIGANTTQICSLLLYHMPLQHIAFVFADIYRTGVEFCTWLKFNFQIAVSTMYQLWSTS